MKQTSVEDYMKKATLMKMAIERHQTYLSSIRAVIHLFQEENDVDEDLTDPAPFEYISHVVKLMDNDLQLVDELFTHQIDVVTQQCQ